MTQPLMCSTSLVTMEFGVFWQPPNALVIHEFTCYAYMGVTAVVPPTANHLAFASPGLAQMLHLQGLSLKPLLILPAETLSEHMHGLWKE